MIPGTKEGDMYTDFLKASGRWVERLVPLDGGKQLMIASLYGSSGASAMADEYMTNEKLLAAAIMRMRSMGNIPYFIATDMNVDPAVTKIVQMAIEANLAYDIVDDAFGGQTNEGYTCLVAYNMNKLSSLHYQGRKTNWYVQRRLK